jgi:hypothetical protein
MSEPINFIKVFVCDYIEDLEKAANDYAKLHRCTPVSAQVTNLSGCIAATVVFKKKV